MDFLGVNWEIIFQRRNYFIPCVVFLCFFIVFFIKYKKPIFLLGICVMLLSIFFYSPWGQSLSMIFQILILVAVLILVFLMKVSTM